MRASVVIFKALTVMVPVIELQAIALPRVARLKTYTRDRSTTEESVLTGSAGAKWGVVHSLATPTCSRERACYSPFHDCE